MNVLDIVREKIVSAGADGLFNDDHGCPLDDLSPADCLCAECQLAKSKIEDDPESEWFGQTVFYPMKRILIYLTCIIACIIAGIALIHWLAPIAAEWFNAYMAG